MKKFLLFCSVISLSFLSVAFADYSVYVEEVGNTDVGFGQTKKYLVEFKKDSQTVKKMYVDKDYELSLSDAPKITDGENNYYTWQITSTNNTSSTLNLDLASSDYKVNENVTLTASLNSFPSSAGSSIQSEYRESGISDGIKKDSQADKSIIYSDLNISINDTVITKNIDAYVSLANSSDYSDSLSLHSGTTNGNAAVNIKFINGEAKKLGDDSIGLEATDEEASDYKPRKGNTTLATKTEGSVNSVSTNYCVRRFVLKNDVIYKGNFNLGAQNGFYSAAEETATDKNSQAAWDRGRQYTGFICGQYYEIDLNGHDLILANGANVNAYGSITDSSKNRSGNLILEPGSNLLASFVTEGQFHETDIVSAYKYSQDPFKMFRCPYINCEMIIKSGSTFQGRIIKADGGNASTAGFSSIANLIGTDDSSLIQLNSGTICRSVSYDDSIKNINTNLTKNLMYQKITYRVYDANISVNYLSFAKITLFDIDISLTSKKYQMWIPPYFNFYIYGSEITLHQEFIFMPGVYMYVDPFSTFTFSNSNVENASIYQQIGIKYYIVKDGMQAVSGMVFLPKFFNVSQHNVPHGLINGGDYDGSDGKSDGDASAPIVYHSVDPFWDYYNKIGSKCDFYGKIKFDDISSAHTHKHEFGGNINFYNISNFIENYNSHSDNINLYGNCVFADYLYGLKGTFLGIGSKNTVSFLVGGFYQIPLISQGYSLLDPTSMSFTNVKKYTYDADLSLISNITDNSYYVFGFKRPNSQMSHPYGSNSGSGSEVYTDGDSLLGRFYKVDTLNKDNLTLSFYNSECNDGKGANMTCINFQGGYINASSINGNNAVAKLGLAVGGDGTCCDVNYTFDFKTSNTSFETTRKYRSRSNTN